MNAVDTLALSCSNLRRRLGRTALTATGVTVGVAALVLMVSLGLGLKRQVLQLFQTEDELRTLSVMRVKVDSARPRTLGLNLLNPGGPVIPITDKDLDEIRAVRGVELAIPELHLLLRIALSAPGREETRDYCAAAGIIPQDEERVRGALLAGRIWTDTDEKALLLPSAFLEFRRHMRPEEAIGSTVIFEPLVADKNGGLLEDERRYTVVGVFRSDAFGLRGHRTLLSMKNALALREAMPSFTSLSGGKGAYLGAEVRATDLQSLPEVKGRLRNYGYEVISATDVIGTLNMLFLIFEAFLACAGAVGLLVSLFGIANTMTMAVLERTREIGIMRSLGARQRDIKRIFMVEAALIGAIGGILGMGAGWGGGAALDILARGTLDLPARISLFYVPLWLGMGAVVFSILMSMAAGSLPARNAARLDPVKALRYE